MPEPIVVAHRGDPVAQVENTLPALRAAVAAGAAIVEIDVRISADGAVVLLHDETTARIWGDPRRADEQTLDQLAALRPDGQDELRIPTLAQALAAAAPAALLIDVPDAPVAIAAWEAVRAAGPSLPAPRWTGVLAGLEAVRERDARARIWMTWKEPGLPDAALLARIRPASWNPPHERVTAASVAAAAQLGIATTCWTVDDPHRARELAELGVAGIISNRAAEIRAHLRAENEERP